MKKKVLVALSGGVDSSITALLLKKSYDLTGITLKVYDVNKNLRKNPLEQGISDAKTLANRLKIPYYVIDAKVDFEQEIIQYFMDEYAAGRTPNPCAKCNYEVKWTKLIELADEFGCEYIATGHYAKINKKDGRYYVSEAHDQRKDQTSFLWRLSQEFLKRTLFPLSGLEKTDIKQIALKMDLKHLANKKESYNVCFIPNGNYRNFLAQRLNEKTGNIVLSGGKIIGQHNGVWNYTIGQKKGIEGINQKDLCVLKIDASKNELLVGEEKELLTQEVILKNLNYQKYSEINDKINLKAKLVYRGELLDCKAKCEGGDELLIKFSKPVSRIAPGQTIVLFEGNDLVVGGVIA